MKKTVLVDDLDGTEAAETVTLALNGDHYEIDLNSGNAEELRTTLARYFEVARPTRLRSGTPKSRTPASPSRRKAVNGTGSVRPVGRQLASSGSEERSTTPTPSEIRAWAAKKGIKVNSTGRISQKVAEQYLADKKS